MRIEAHIYVLGGRGEFDQLLSSLQVILCMVRFYPAGHIDMYINIAHPV